MYILTTLASSSSSPPPPSSHLCEESAEGEKQKLCVEFLVCNFRFSVPAGTALLYCMCLIISLRRFACRCSRSFSRLMSFHLKIELAVQAYDPFQ